jgi:hypothetical protein
VNAVWPGSSMHYQQVIERPRYEDMHMEYFDKNPWAHLGMGWTVENRAGAQGADCSPYLNINNIDPKWQVDHDNSCRRLTNRVHRYEAIGGDVETLKKQQNHHNQL